MKNAVILLLFLSLTLSACNFTGKAFDVPINTSAPGLYIDGPGRVNIINTSNGEPFPLIEISVIAAQYENITGFQFNLNYNGPAVFAEPAIPGGAFGNLVNTTYFCVPYQNTGASVDDLSCASLPNGGSAAVPNTAGYAFLYNLSFLTTGAGQVYLSIDTTDTLNGPTVLADSNQEKLELVGNTAHKTINLCMDADGDGEFSTLSCETDGDRDCRDDLVYANSNHPEWCNGFDNNCDGNPTAGSINCAQYAPEINSITANSGVQLFDDADPGSDYNPTLSGLISFSVDVTDTSIGPDGSPTGNNIDRVEFRVEGNLIGTDGTNGKSRYTISDWDSTGQADDVPLNLEVTVYDELDGIVPRAQLTKQFTLNNNAVCDITSISWDQASVNDGGSIGLTVVGSPDCDGKEFTYSSGKVQYLECDGSTCEAVPSNIVSSLPGNTISFVGSTTFTDTGVANWFFDNGGADNNPEIKIVVTDDETNDQPIEDETGLLEIVNVAPTIEDQGQTIGPDSAQVYLTVNELSRFTLNYGTTSGNLNQEQISGALATSRTFTITGLQPQTTYYYMITARDQGSLPVSTGELSFTTVTYQTDYDNDGDVDLFDLYDALVYYGTSRSDDTTFWDNNLVNYDLDNNGELNILDLVLVLQTYTG